jgi:hypothetical protein
MKTLKIVIAILCISLLASSCAAGIPPASGVLSGTASPATDPTTLPILAPTQTPEAAEPAAPAAKLELYGLAQAVATLVLPEVQPGAENPGAVVMPQRTLLWLYGYPISVHAQDPQIFLFKVDDLATNDRAAQAVQDLQALLQSQPEGNSLPFLPLTADVQQVHAQVKTLDFHDGKGVRFLTQYGNGMSPINNQQIFYTFQGLTGDGKFYVAAVLPVNLNGLPSDPLDTSNLPLEFASDYPTYITGIVNQLNLQAPGDYAPNLDTLDALVQSIEVE